MNKFLLLEGKAIKKKSLWKFVVAMLAAMPLAAHSEENAASTKPDTSMLDTVVVNAPEVADKPLGASTVDKFGLAAKRSGASDTTDLLQDIPGVSSYGAGGISSLPAIHGLADDRVRVEVDGMELMSACPNHMNSPLSYINPTRVAKVTVFAGITPVSAGGDSIGGTIQVKSAPPEFARDDASAYAKGQAGVSYRSNGKVRGYNAGATWAGHGINMTYDESNSQADNYKAGGNFKAVSRGREGGPWLPGNIVGSSAYQSSRNRDIGLALQRENHLFQLNAGEQTVDFEGFPNQRMDMTDNKNTLINLHYTGQYKWGELEARIYDQDTRHKMDMGPDRYFFGTGMPMESKAKTRGVVLQGGIVLSERDILRLGGEHQYYTLYDWWPPAGTSGVSMCCKNFWNVDYGQRNKTGLFGEWEANWNPEWISLLGIRSDTVMSDAGPVQGYSTGPGSPYLVDAAAFNALDRKRTDRNWDLTALARYTPDGGRTYEAGYARKSRSPNLYQRYPWSTFPMAALMNNFVGDGNGYIGNVNLKPEVANTFSASGDWHDPGNDHWGVKATGYYTYIQDYIDAQRCNAGQWCDSANMTEAANFVLLRYVNQSARLYGMDLSGHTLLGNANNFGSFTGNGVLSYVKGENRTTGGHLYHIMPLNTKLSVVQRLNGWTNTAELQLVAAKTRVSQVRNEAPTSGYGLFNLRSSYQWKHARLDMGIENVFNRLYFPPLGGAYVGQGNSMTSGAIPWGINVPGLGRSINAALNLSF